MLTVIESKLKALEVLLSSGEYNSSSIVKSRVSLIAGKIKTFISKWIYTGGGQQREFQDKDKPFTLLIGGSWSRRLEAIGEAAAMVLSGLRVYVDLEGVEKPCKTCLRYQRNG